MQFSTHESVSLEKQVELHGKPVKTASENVHDIYEIQRCAEWIQLNNYKKVCLQFPDHLLADSGQVALELQAILKQVVYILGDTAYGSCCIDYVAAAHINADAIIHFGPSCFSKSSANLPFLNIYEKHSLDVDEFKLNYDNTYRDSANEIIILVDTQYILCADKLLETFKESKIVKVDENLDELVNKNILFLSDNKQKLLNISFTLNPNTLHYYDSDLSKIVNYQQDSRILKRSYFLSEKIKDSKTIGIVIGTVAVQNYLKIIERIKKLVEANGKKYYLISVGKPTVAKLANFAEIDVYVIISCILNEIYDSRDFFKPIVTPYDIEMALNPNPSNELKYSYDYNAILSDDIDMEKLQVACESRSDVSLLTGQIRYKQSDNLIGNSSNSENKIALKTEGTIAVSSSFGAGFLANRTWKGLEQSLGQTEVKLAEDGRSGIAQGYDNEPCK